MARAIAEALGPDRRRLISARLARHYAGRGAHPARVAGYFEAAGQLQEAADWWFQAAQQAHSLRAYCEADGYYRQASGSHALRASPALRGRLSALLSGPTGGP